MILHKILFFTAAFFTLVVPASIPFTAVYRLGSSNQSFWKDWFDTMCFLSVLCVLAVVLAGVMSLSVWFIIHA